MFNQNIKFVKKTKSKLIFSRKKTSKQIKSKSKTKKRFFRKTQATKEKQGNRAKTSFLQKKHANFEQIWEAKHFLEILENADQMIFFFGKAHEVRSTRTLVVQTCTENVRLPISMQALIWFPEVLRITLTFERLWESRQKRLKNDLTVDNY